MRKQKWKIKTRNAIFHTKSECRIFVDFSAHNRQFGKMASDVLRMKCFRIFTFVASQMVGAKPLPLRQAETVGSKCNGRPDNNKHSTETRKINPF